MSRRIMAALCLGAAVLLNTRCGDDADQLFYEFGEASGLEPAQWRGRELYGRYCAGCHGERGNGMGPAAPFLDPKPRDFTRGTYKFRTTPSSSLPTDADLVRTIREGVHGTSMPAWTTLPDAEVQAIVAWIKTFSKRFARERPAPTLALPGAPKDLDTAARVERGQRVWDELKCGLCHGERGQGDGPSAKSLIDSEGHPIPPFDFTRKEPKGGSTPEDLYRTFMTGLAGTPMPDFAETTRDDTQRWDLVAYVRSLRAGAAKERR
ncbi:MAG: cytochrome c [Planctomycetes bacterium]|nr:cytochrome c [Planctomycetota bacterium]